MFVPSYSLFSSIILDAFTLNVSLSYLIFLVYFTPTDEAKALLSFYLEFGKAKLCYSKVLSFTFPELVIDVINAVVASEFPESLKFFLFISAFSEAV